MDSFSRNDIDNDAGSDLLNAFDFEKLLKVTKKSWWMILLLFIVAMSLGYFGFIRWSKPVYQSSSVLKLDFKSEANTLGLTSGLGTNELSELSGEIELLRSTLFFSKVADAVNMNVSYFFYGNVLEDERYGNSPFEVFYKLKTDAAYDRPFDVVIVDDSNFNLIYADGGERISSSHRFGQNIENDYFSGIIQKTHHFSATESLGKYYFKFNSEGSIINFLKNNVQVQPENFNAKTIRISLQDYSRVKAADLLQAIDTLYLEFTKNAKNQTIEQKIAFLDSQIKSTESKLEEYEAYFESFIVENRTMSLQNDMAKTLVKLDMLDSQQINLNMKRIKVELLQDQLSQGQTLGTNVMMLTGFPEQIQGLLTQYRTLSTERASKLVSYSEKTQVVQQIDQQLGILLSDLNEILSVYRRGLEDGLKEVNRKRIYLEQNLQELPSMNTLYGKKRRFYQLQEEFLLSLRKSKMELEITKAGTVANFVILSPPSIPHVPIQPKEAMIYGVSLAIAVVLSLLLVLVRYLLNSQIGSVKELEKLISVPLLGSIPNYNKGKMDVSKLVIRPNSKSAVSESLRAIRTNMEFLNGSNQTNIITVTSTVSGEGKTFVAVNLGAIFAFSNQKVVIVDLDMRKPKVHRAFEDEAGAVGVSTLLIGKSSLEECIRPTQLENMDYIPAGPNPPNPSELILNDEYKSMLEKLKATYDMVILDTPPVGLVTDAVLSMRNSDVQIYVLRADYSQRSFVKTLQNLSQGNKFSNLTAVFNSVKGTGGSYGYGYGYGYGYYEESAD